MATLTKVSPSLSTVEPCPAHSITGLVAGEAIPAGSPCYIKSDGKVWLSDGTADTAPAKVDGWAPIAAAVGQPITLLFDVNFRYAAGLTPGARYYVSATKGELDDAATTGGKAYVAFAIDAQRIRVLQSRY